MKVKVDGTIYEAYPGETVLKLCRRIGIEIPTLCFDERLEPFTSCWVCLVEVKNRRGLSPACGIYLESGMEIRTRGEDIFNARKTAIELLLSTHFGDCYPPCTLRCPSNVDIQGYIGLVGSGKYIDAVNLIRKTNPFPSICGRVCTRPCEESCRRNILDMPVGIDYIKRFAADLELENPSYFIPPRKPSTGYKIALIGAGPASLTAAYYLSLNGHKTTVFEAEEEPGGTMRYGIPPYRLPRDVIKKEIEIIEATGVEIKTGRKLGKDFTLDDLYKEGYNAIFIGVGAWRSMPMDIEGEKSDGVFGGIDFLREVAKGNITKLQGKVVVVGGGNTAIDAARTSLRLGANEVSILYRRTEKEMPARKEEVEEAIYEGVKIQFLVAPKRVLCDEKGRLKALECIRMELGEPDSSGRRRPVPVQNSEFVIDCDYIIAAIGQKPDKALLENALVVKGEPVKWTKWGTIEVNPETLQTNIPNLFAGGDAVTGPATVIEAIASGRRAAFYIDRALKNEPMTGFNLPINTSKRSETLQDFPREFYKDLPTTQRNMPKLTKLSERRNNFDEVELPYTEEEALNESLRCLSCGCIAVDYCELKRLADQYGANSYAFTKEREIKKIDSRHPFIEFDMNKCILCARCVRICDELMGITALGFIYRGYNTIIAPAIQKPLQNTDCIACGQCIDTCPTGAIIEKPDIRKPAPFKYEETQTTCGYCSVGCSLVFECIDSIPIKTKPDKACAVSGGNLCVKGKFGLKPLMESRAGAPVLRNKGKHSNIPFDKAFEFLPEILNKGEGNCVFISPALTNEEIFLSIMLAKEGLRSKGIYSFYLSPLNLKKKEEFPISTISLNEIDKNSLIILHDLDLTRTAPIVGVKVRQAVKNGALLIAVDSSTKMFRMLDNVVSIGFDTRAIKEIIEKNAKNFNNAIVISKARPSSNKLTEWFTIRNLQHEFSLELAWGYLFVGAPANIQGLIDMFIPIDKEEMIPFDECMRMLKGGELSALIIGEDPIGAQYPYRVALEGASSLVVLDGYLTETASLADLFIPISLWHETAGTFTNLERRLRKLNKITEPPSGYSTISILEKIGNSFGIKLPSDPVTIFEKLSDEIKQYAEFEIDNVYDLNLLSVNCEKLTIPPAKEDFEHSIPESDTSYFQKALINYLKHKGLKNLPA